LPVRTAATPAGIAPALDRNGRVFEGCRLDAEGKNRIIAGKIAVPAGKMTFPAGNIVFPMGRYLIRLFLMPYLITLPLRCLGQPLFLISAFQEVSISALDFVTANQGNGKKLENFLILCILQVIISCAK
jgi:hypothetical protein